MSVAALMSPAADSARGQLVFHRIADETENIEPEFVTGVSADGSVVVGFGASPNGLEAFRWSATDGLVGLGDLIGGPFQSRAFGVSSDGTTTVGEGTNWVRPEAFRTTSPTGITGLGSIQPAPGVHTPSAATAVSANGSIVVGESGQPDSRVEAFRWAPTTGMRGLGDLDGGAFMSRANDVSADGSVIVGVGDTDRGPEAFRWTEADGMVGLGGDVDAVFCSEALAISADGEVVVGTCCTESEVGIEAFRWTAETGIERLAPNADGLHAIEATGVSGDGRIIVGRGRIDDQGEAAFIWDAVRGVRSLHDVLTNDFGLDVTGCSLTQATDISEDGLTIIGVGIDPDGMPATWRVTAAGPRSIPADGHIDAGAEVGGVDRLRLRVPNASPETVCEAIRVDVTDNPLIPGLPQAPLVAESVIRTLPCFLEPCPTEFVVTLAEPIPPGEWTTLTVTCCDDDDDCRTDSVRIGHLPCDVDGNGHVNIRDATAFGNLFRQQPRDDRIDLDRSGVVNISDATEFGRLWHGIDPATQPWRAMRLPDPPE